MKKLRSKTSILTITFIICVGVFLSLAYADDDSTSSKSWYWYLGQKLQEEDTSSITEDNIIAITVHRFPEPTITEVDGYHHVEMEELSSLANTGEPVLPVKNINVLIPPGKRIKDTEVILGEKMTLPGEYIVEPGQEQVPLSYEGDVEKTLPKDEIYNSTIPFPLERKKLVTIQDMCGYRIAIFNIHPMEYIPSLGELSYYKSISIKVNLEGEEKVEGEEEITGELGRVMVKKPRFRNLSSDKKRLEEFVDNPQDISSYDALMKESEIQTLGNGYTADMQTLSGSGSAVGTIRVNPQESYQYVVITNEYLKNTPGPYNFQALLAEKETRGIKTKIVTTEWIYANYDGKRPDGRIDNATKIRNFIIDAYNNWETEFILLGGDATGNSLYQEIIPARSLYDDPWVGSPYATLIPSDLYYSCLDGTMDANRNGIYGEPYDGLDRGVYDREIDLVAEVYIGRAPVATREELSNFVRKTLEYKTTSSDYLLNTYQVGEQLADSGAMKFASPCLEEIKSGSNAHGYATAGFASMRSLQLNTLYDDDYYRWGTSELIDIINYDGVHILNHLGHSYIDKNMKLFIYDISALTNTEYFFAYSQGCWPGAFDRDCIVERFVKRPSGAFAFVGNSRYGWGNKYSTAGASQYYARQFWDAVFGEGKFRLGEVNQDSKEDNLPTVDYPCHRWCYLELNLFGDPELALRLGNQGSPVTPPPPVADFSTSQRSGRVPHTVNFKDISTGAITGWLWNFGDGTTSALQNPGHSYNSAGTYTVSLKVTGPGGSDTETKQNYITVTPPPPVANFNVSQRSVKVSQSISFTNASTGIITSWLWNFGDGTTSTLQNPSHTYNSAGTYTVSLKVTGPGGSDTETKRDYITVTSPPSISRTYIIPNQRRFYIIPNYNSIYRYIANWLWNFWNT